MSESEKKSGNGKKMKWTMNIVATVIAMVASAFIIKACSSDFVTVKPVEFNNDPTGYPRMVPCPDGTSLHSCAVTSITGKTECNFKEIGSQCELLESVSVEDGDKCKVEVTCKKI
ncbi:hypothetical protein [Photobacterium sp. OFAV2-7]|uniref:hypothetical protein n=1 Tax=Photobacterium sp. OFAV2-7 TaxID=2917748 RepID=UPI001EF6146D|nr:hypothetical protein [Photobacterium sp. OFAV2-7]MCG7584577.1 hypothetical protein [Photobacterium sp. OFAV2-7]